MSYWTIRLFVSDVQGWINSRNPKAKAKIEARIRHLENATDWKPYVKKLKGYKNLYEIKIIHNNIQYRLIGCYGPNVQRREFTILVCAIEKEGKYNPPSVFETAERRSKLIFQNEGYSYEY
jgi:hypothetical protein